MSDFIQVDGYLQNLRTEASNNAINLFILELKSKGGHTLFMSDFDNMYNKYQTKACNQFQKDCDYFFENCPSMKDLININRPRHLQKLKDHLEEFNTEMRKINKLKRDKNFERIIFGMKGKPQAWLEFAKILKEVTFRIQIVHPDYIQKNFERIANDECYQTFGIHDPWSMDIWP